MHQLLYSLILMLFIVSSSVANDWVKYISDAELMLKSGNLDKALEIALKIEKDVENSSTSQINKANGYNLLGKIYLKSKVYGKSGIYFRKALNAIVLSDGDNKKNRLNILKNLIILYIHTGEYELAEPFAAEIINYIRSDFDTTGAEYASALSNMASIRATFGNIEESCKLLEQSSFIYHNLKDTLSFLKDVSSLYKLQMYSGDYSRALVNKRILAEISRIRNNNLAFAENLCDMAAVMLNIGELQTALSVSDSSLSVFRSLYGDNSPVILKYLDCISRKAQILEMSGRLTESKSLWIECCLHLRNYVYNEFFRSNEKLNRSDSRIITDCLDRFNLFAIKHYADNPDLLVVMLDNRLVIKSSILNSSAKLLKNLRPSMDTSSIGLLERWRGLKGEILDYYTQPAVTSEIKEIIRQLEHEAEKLEAELADLPGEFSKRMYYFDIDYNILKNSLPNNAAAVDIIRIGGAGGNVNIVDVIYALIIVKKNEEYPGIVILNNGSYLENFLLKAYSKSVRHELYFSDVYENFWAPAMKELAGIERIFIGAEGLFSYINLNTIQYENRKYLIDKFEFIHLTNLRDIVKESSHSKLPESKREAVLFGAPKIKYDAAGNRVGNEPEGNYKEADKDCSQLTELPDAAIEIKAISNLLRMNDWSVHTLIGAEADKEAFLFVNNPALLHLATHGYYYHDSKLPGPVLSPTDEIEIKNNPMLNSGIIAARLPSQDSSYDVECSYDIVNAYEIASMNLDKTELVVVSACQSGVGFSANAAEGLYGLQRAFILAGAQSLVLSLWNIDDLKTRIFMTEFYKYWIDTKSIPEAFHLTQLKLKNQGFKAWEWGAFLLISCPRLD